MNDYLDDKYKYIKETANKYRKEIYTKDEDIKKLKFEKGCIEDSFIVFIKNLQNIRANWFGAKRYINEGIKDENNSNYNDYVILKNTLNFFFGFPDEIEITKIISYGYDEYANEILFNVNNKTYYIFIPNTKFVNVSNYVYMHYGEFGIGIYHENDSLVTHDAIISTYDPLDINHALKEIMKEGNNGRSKNLCDKCIRKQEYIKENPVCKHCVDNDEFVEREENEDGWT